MNNPTKEKLWTKSFVMMMVGNFFVFMSFQMLIPTLPPYIKSIGASPTEIGLVTALFSVAAIVVRPLIGHMLAYRARKPLVVAGVISLFLITLIYPLSSMVLIFLLIRFIHGLAWGWSTTVNGTAVVDVVPNSRLGEGMGYFGLSTTIGMIIAPSLGIYLFQETTFTILIAISSALGLIAIFLMSIVRYQTPESVMNVKKHELKFSYMGSLLEKSSWYPAFITMIATFGYGSIVTFIVIFGDERGIDQIFLFYLFNALMASLSRPIAGKWFDRRGPKGLVLFCIALSFIGMWVLSFSYTNMHIAISGMLFGVGFGSLIPTLQSWTISKTPASRRGVANGMFYSALDMGIGLSGFVFGILAQFFEISTLFQISSAFLILALVLTVAEGRKTKLIARQKAIS